MEHCGTEINWEIWQVFYDKSRQNYANLLKSILDVLQKLHSSCFLCLAYYTPVPGAYHHGWFSLIFQSKTGRWVQHGPNILSATRNNQIIYCIQILGTDSIWNLHVSLLWQVQALIQSHFHKTKALLWKTLSRPQEPQAQWIPSDSVVSKNNCL